MAVTETPATNGQAVTAELDSLAEQLDRFLATAVVVPAVAAARAACNEAGVHRYVRELFDAEELLARAMTQKRQAEAAVDDCKSAYATATAEAEWMLGDRFITEANKTYLVGPADPASKRQMTADEKRAWLAREAAKTPAVAEAAGRLREAEMALAESRDAIELARLAHAARKHALDASVEVLRTLALSLGVARKAGLCSGAVA